MTEVLIPLTDIYGVDDDSELSWMDRALCAEIGDDFWYPEKGGSTREPKAVCQACEVRAECLQYALDHDERFGVWGGLSERERRRLKRPQQGPRMCGSGQHPWTEENIYAAPDGTKACRPCRNAGNRKTRAARTAAAAASLSNPQPRERAA